jgi:hypothetical protein
MCRNIKSLYNFEPPATEEEIQAAALQFVRKISGFHEPSKVNEKAFDKSVENIAKITQQLLDCLVTQAHSRNRELEAAKARSRAVKRFSI